MSKNEGMEKNSGGEDKPLEGRIEVQILEVIQGTYNHSKLFNLQFQTHSHIVVIHKVLGLLSRSWSKSSEWPAMNPQNCDNSLSRSLSLLEVSCCLVLSSFP